MNKVDQWYLQSMGITSWIPQDEQDPCADVSINSATTNDSTTSMNWQSLEKTVSQCRLCELHKTRTQTVFGVGNQQADLLIVGEAPGRDEDLKGEPFVGRAGKLLDEMLYAIGYCRNDIYIANILKCRPPKNRDPKPSEQECCTPYLLRQIELIQPKLILALGRIAAQYLLQSNVSLGRLREKNHIYSEQKIPLMVSYHPAYLLRNPIDKRKSYEDLIKIKHFLMGAR